MSNSILGISAYYHDSASSLVQDGKIVAAAQEERFSRIKHDAKFPAHAISYCLDEAGLKLTDLDKIVFYEKPLVTFERLLETYLSYAPKGLRSFTTAMPVWLKEKLYIKSTLKKELAALAGCKKTQLPALLFSEHHQSHAASAFYPSPFKKAAVLCLDGVGEWATSSAWLGNGNQLSAIWELEFPHSLGLLYSAFTYYTGFRVNSGEYKLMGLAAYGEPKYVDLILDNLLDLKEDGTFRLNLQYFDYCAGLRMTNEKFDMLFGGQARQGESAITQREMDIAASIQTITEKIVMRMARSVHKETGEDYLCLAGGVALNCVSNGKLLRNGPFKDIWVQPAAGDAGGSLGAALVAWYADPANVRTNHGSDSMSGSFLGPRFNTNQIKAEFDGQGATYLELEEDELFNRLAHELNKGKIVGWFQGRMEFGPRALGARSIIGDPRNTSMQSVMNLKIKYRESFRPFAPSVLAERVSDYFEHDRPSPYMLMVARVNNKIRIKMTKKQKQLFGIKKLNIKRSELPAITHVDYSARVQTVHKKTNPRYHRLLEVFDKLTGCGVLVNTSFNVRGEPIVCTPSDAYRCFMHTQMDFLVVENFLLMKTDQPEFENDDAWIKSFDPD